MLKQHFCARLQSAKPQQRCSKSVILTIFPQLKLNLDAFKRRSLFDDHFTRMLDLLQCDLTGLLMHISTHSVNKKIALVGKLIRARLGPPSVFLHQKYASPYSLRVVLANLNVKS